MEWISPKHGSDSFGFAFLCSHLASRVGTGFHVVPDDEHENEPRPPALCDACEAARRSSGGFQSSRVCGACYDEVKAEKNGADLAGQRVITPVSDNHPQIPVRLI
jgi:hypothetical protein